MAEPEDTKKRATELSDNAFGTTADLFSQTYFDKLFISKKIFFHIFLTFLGHTF